MGDIGSLTEFNQVISTLFERHYAVVLFTIIAIDVAVLLVSLLIDYAKSSPRVLSHNDVKTLYDEHSEDDYNYNYKTSLRSSGFGARVTTLYDE